MSRLKPRPTNSSAFFRKLFRRAGARIYGVRLKADATKAFHVWVVTIERTSG